MTGEPKKPLDGGPVLRRDAENKLDMDSAREATDELYKKLLQENRAYDKEMSHLARTGRRDIVVMLGVYVRNSVNGKVALQDDSQRGFHQFGEDDPYKYKTIETATVEFPAKGIPGSKEYIGKGLMTGFHMVVKWLASIGAIRG